MRNTKEQKGITLIALIITIIVMIILVAVSVSVALQGGIFDKATTASKQMEQETIYEDIISSMDVKNNGDIDVESTFTEVQEKYAGKIPRTDPELVNEKLPGGTTKVTFDITGKRGTYTYTITEKEIKIGTGEGETEEKFTWTLKEDSGSAGISEGDVVNCKSKEGADKNVDIDYYVLAINDNTVDLISANTLGTVKLGYEDESATSGNTHKEQSEYDSMTEEEYFTRAANSYNHAVETIVTACKNATGLTIDGTNVISIRSVGNTNVKYISDTEIVGNDGGTYSYNLEETGAESDWYTPMGYDMKPGDVEENFKADTNLMQSLGIINADDGANYWLASRYVEADSDGVYLMVRKIIGHGRVTTCDDFCGVLNDGESYGCDPEYGVRAVVTLKSSAIADQIN